MSRSAAEGLGLTVRKQLLIEIAFYAHDTMETPLYVDSLRCMPRATTEAELLLLCATLGVVALCCHYGIGRLLKAYRISEDTSGSFCT